MNLLGEIHGIVQFVQVLNGSLDIDDRLDHFSSLSNLLLFSHFLFDRLALRVQDLIDFLEENFSLLSLPSSLSLSDHDIRLHRCQWVLQRGDRFVESNLNGSHSLRLVLDQDFVLPSSWRD